MQIQLLKKNILLSIEAKQLLLEDTRLHLVFKKAATCLINKYKVGGRLYIAGNGGSAADAQHLAAEFVSKLSRDRDALPAEALTVDSSVITAIGNDYGFDQIFSRQLEGKLTENDVFLGISTSGNSPNIVRALETCKHKKIPTILFAGKGGGRAADLADFSIIAPGENTATIQEIHIILSHTLCEIIENSVIGN